MNVRMDTAIEQLSNKTTIKNKTVSGSFHGAKYNSIKTFYDDFISKRFPDIKDVVAWHNLLMDYVDKPGNTLFVRAPATSGALRRGWITEYECENEKFKVVFSDNDLAAIVYKIVLDGYVPDQNTFFEYMTTFDTWDNIKWHTSKRNIKNQFDLSGVERKFLLFPVHFNRSGGQSPLDKMENERNGAVISGIESKIGDLGYKLAHIFNAGENYVLSGGQIIGMKDINDKYIKLKVGDEKDYVWKDNGQYSNYLRKVPIQYKKDFDMIKQIAVACTLRFIDPVNHFLSPKSGSNLYIDRNNKIRKDVAEYDYLTIYVAQRRREEFLKEGVDISTFYKKALIDFKYDSGILQKPFELLFVDGINNVSVKTPRKQNKKKQQIITNILTGGLAIGKYAKKSFEVLLRQNKLSPSLISKLRDENYCKQQLGIRYAVLSLTRVPEKRYYSKPVGGYYICNDWYPKHRDRLEDWLKNNII